MYNINHQSYLVLTGMNHFLGLSPNTSWKLLYLPKLKPCLSSPVLNIGALNASKMLQTLHSNIIKFKWFVIIIFNLFYLPNVVLFCITK